MNIIEQIQNSIETSTGLEMHYHAVGELNDIFDDVDFPAAYSFLIDSGAVTDNNGQYHERISMAVFFVNLTDYDFNAVENETIIAQCKENAFEWLTALRLDDSIRLVEVTQTQRVYDTFDVNVTGYGVNVTIEEVQGIGACNFR